MKLTTKLLTLLLILFVDIGDANSQDRWWQREIPTPSATQTINPIYLSKKRELEKALDEINDAAQRKSYYQNQGQNTRSLDDLIQHIGKKMNTLEHELSNIPIYISNNSSSQNITNQPSISQQNVEQNVNINLQQNTSTNNSYKQNNSENIRSSPPELLLELDAATTRLRTVDISSDCRFVCMGGDNGPTKVWDLQVNQEYRSFDNGSKVVFKALFSEDDRYLITHESDNTVRKWNIYTGELLSSVQFTEPEWIYPFYSNDNRYLYIVETFDRGPASYGKSAPQKIALSILETSTATRKAYIEFQPMSAYHSGAHHQMILDVALSKSKNFIATAGGDGFVIVYDIKQKKPLAILSHNTRENVRAVKFSEDGRYIASGADDGSIKIWDFSSKELIKTFYGTKGVNDLDFSTSGFFLASVHDSGEINVWNLDWDSRPYKVFKAKDDCRSVKFSSNDKYILVGDFFSSKALVWDVEQ